MGNQAIRLTIDGIEVEVKRGRTILEAAQSAGVRIPSLCHDRRLIPFGAC
ncbi:MAG: 2Fe-2S iron-sulfur cluster-binding protein, partial [Thermodesulfobacteriota bacterium]|nr:2Fe-2S iron-sulfur cluster-binding protein [Thermodesulfobacteriota bacterium]